MTSQVYKLNKVGAFAVGRVRSPGKDPPLKQPMWARGSPHIMCGGSGGGNETYNKRHVTGPALNVPPVQISWPSLWRGWAQLLTARLSTSPQPAAPGNLLVRDLRHSPTTSAYLGF